MDFSTVMINPLYAVNVIKITNYAIKKMHFGMVAENLFFNQNALVLTLLTLCNSRHVFIDQIIKLLTLFARDKSLTKNL
jgi:hypothetical protein